MDAQITPTAHPVNPKDHEQHCLVNGGHIHTANTVDIPLDYMSHCPKHGEEVRFSNHYDGCIECAKEKLAREGLPLPNLEKGDGIAAELRRQGHDDPDGFYRNQLISGPYAGIKEARNAGKSVYLSLKYVCGDCGGGKFRVDNGLCARCHPFKKKAGPKAVEKPKAPEPKAPTPAPVEKPAESKAPVKEPRHMPVEAKRQLAQKARDRLANPPEMLEEWECPPDLWAFPQSAAIARACGATRYFPRHTCQNGHISPWRTSNRRCLECKREDDRAAKASKKEADRIVNPAVHKVGAKYAKQITNDLDKENKKRGAAIRQKKRREKQKRLLEDT